MLITPAAAKKIPEWPNYANLQKAKEILAANPEKPFSTWETGWELAADGEWRTEIPNPEFVPGIDKHLQPIIDAILANSPDSIFKKKEYGVAIQKCKASLDNYQNELNKIAVMQKMTIDKHLLAALARQEENIKLKMEPDQRKLNKMEESLAQIEASEHGSYECLLAEMFTAPELFKAYPKLANVKITVEHSKNPALGGAYSPTSNSIVAYVNYDMMNRQCTDIVSKAIRSTLLHEMQHAIQEYDDLARGGNDNTAVSAVKKIIAATTAHGAAEGDAAYERFHIVNKNLTALSKVLHEPLNISAYRALAGETEARNVSKRDSMSPEDLKKTAPSQTADIKMQYQFAVTSNEELIDFDKKVARIVEEYKAEIASREAAAAKSQAPSTPPPAKRKGHSDAYFIKAFQPGKSISEYEPYLATFLHERGAPNSSKHIKVNTHMGWNHNITGFSIYKKEVIAEIYWQGSDTDGSESIAIKDVQRHGKVCFPAEQYFDGYRTRTVHSDIEIDCAEVIEAINSIANELARKQTQEKNVSASITDITGGIVKPNTAGIDAKLKAMQQPKTVEQPAQTVAKTKSTGIGM